MKIVTVKLSTHAPSGTHTVQAKAAGWVTSHANVGMTGRSVPVIISSIMHPPDFSYNHLLSDWPECNIELRCERCHGRSVNYPVKMLIRRKAGSGQTFAEAIGKLRCRECGHQPERMYLCASFCREWNVGMEPGWSIELRLAVAKAEAALHPSCRQR